MAVPFDKILIANRGEIAVRVIRACREMGIRTVAVYSEADRDALHVRMADQAFAIGPSPSSESYLRGDKILDVAERSGAGAVHPGYGFLAENGSFARDCIAAGVTFIGPPPDALEAMGNKVQARRTMVAAGAPVIPGSEGRVASADDVRAWGEKLGYPLLLKAESGGGGKGMRVLEGPGDVDSGYRAARSEARSSFGDDSVYIERFFKSPRHIEFQILFDMHGHGIHLGERECSVQRRHQKLVEEAPSPAVDSETRARMGEVALTVGRACGYVGAGTVEFLRDDDGKFYFMEMNARLQVEHPVTEMLTGLDLVKHQIRIAAGEPLLLQQSDVQFRGHAIECRIVAEDADHDFMPCPGTITSLRVPSGPGVRDDSSVYAGFEMPLFYDPMFAKLITWGHDRGEAIERMSRALREYVVGGFATTIPFHRRVMHDPRFLSGDYNTGYLAQMPPREEASAEREEQLRRVAVMAAAVATYRRKTAGTVRAAAPSSAWKSTARREGLR